MRKTILVAGSAGGGVKSITDKILPSVFVKAGHEVSSNVTYGAAQRSGHVIGDVVLGGGGQHYYADVILALTQEGFDNVKGRVNENTIIIYDSAAIKQESLPTVGTKVSFVSGDSKYNNLSGAGTLFKVLGVKEDQKENLSKIIKGKFKKDADKSLEMVLRGFDAAVNISDALSLSSLAEADSYLMSGNEAAVWGALMGGANFYAGYPITPSSEAMHEWARVCYEFNGVMKQANSEEQAIGLVLGAAAKGARAWTATSGPGLSRMLEQIGYALASRTPFVIYNAQRGGPSTGMPTQTQQSDIITAIKGGHGDYPMIVLSPSNAQETFDLMSMAFKLARMYSIGVILNSSKEVGQRRSKVNFSIADYDKVDYSLEHEEKRCRTGLTADSEGRPKTDPSNATAWLDRIFEKFEKDYDKLSMAKFKNIEFEKGNSPYDFKGLAHEEFYKAEFTASKIKKAPETVYLGFGETVPILEELVENKKDAGMIGLLSLHPFPIKMLKELKKAGAKKLVIAEQNRGYKVHSEEGQLASKIRQYFKGKAEVLTKYDGEPFFADKL